VFAILSPEDINIKERTGLLASVQSSLRCFGTSISLLGNGRVIVPFLIYFIIKVFIVFFYVHVISDPFISFWALFINKMSGADLSHYPEHIIVMQKILQRFDIVLELFLNPIFQGATIFIVASAFSKISFTVREGISKASKKYTHLVITAIIASALMLASVYLPDLIFGQPGGLFNAITPATGSVLGLIVQAFLVYAFPFIILRGENALFAMAGSFKLSKIFFGRSIILVALPFILTIPTLFLEFNAEIIAIRLSPEFIIYLQVVKEVIQLISNYLLFGAATVMFVRLTGKKANNSNNNNQEDK
jgi:hypothetical protein